MSEQASPAPETEPSADEISWPVGTLRCPDGTQFVIYADHSWQQEAWDGGYVRSSEDSESMTPADLAGYDPATAWTPAP